MSRNDWILPAAAAVGGMFLLYKLQKPIVDTGTGISTAVGGTGKAVSDVAGTTADVYRAIFEPFIQASKNYGSVASGGSFQTSNPFSPLSPILPPYVNTFTDSFFGNIPTQTAPMLLSDYGKNIAPTQDQTVTNWFNGIMSGAI